MSRQVLTTDNAPSSPLFGQGVKVGSVVYVSGMTGTDVTTGKLAGPTIQDQTRQAIRNCAAILAAGGAALDDVAKGLGALVVAVRTGFLEVVEWLLGKGGDGAPVVGSEITPAVGVAA